MRHACSTRNFANGFWASPRTKRATREWLADKITLFGAKLPNVAEVADAEKNSWQYLLADLDEEQHCSAELIEELEAVRDELPDIAAVLERIYEDGEKHRAAIRDMLMRSDPQAV